MSRVTKEPLFLILFMSAQNKEIIIVSCAAILVGVIIAFPAAYFHFFDSAYRGIEFLGSDAEIGYLAQAQEIADGHFNLGNPYLVDLKDRPYVQQPLSPAIMAGLSTVLGLSIPQGAIIAQFFFPAFLTIIIYLFFKEITKQKKISLFISLFIMMASASLIFMNPRAWIPFFTKGIFIGTDPQFLSYARAINPQISSLFFFGYLLFLYKCLYGTKQKKLFGIFAALLLGLSFYTYFFTFSFLFTFNAFVLTLLWYQKDRLRFKHVLIISLAAACVGIPYLINMYAVVYHPAYIEVVRRLGAVGNHAFIFSRVWWIVLFLFLCVRNMEMPKSMKNFIFSFLGASFFVTNQQVITGYTAPIPSHYHWYYIAPVGGAVAIYLLFIYADRKIKKILLNGLLLAGSLLFIISGIMFQKYSYAAQYRFFVSDQRYADVINWMRSLPKDGVVFGNEDISSYVPAYTSLNVYYNHYEADFLVSQNRLVHSYFINLYLRGITDTTMRAFLDQGDNRGLMGGALFGQYYRNLNGCYGCFSDSVLNSFIEEYKEFLHHDFLEQLKKYPFNYVVWDKKNDPQWHMDKLFKKTIYEKDNILVYIAE